MLNELIQDGRQRSRIISNVFILNEPQATRGEVLALKSTTIHVFLSNILDDEGRARLARRSRTPRDRVKIFLPYPCPLCDPLASRRTNEVCK